jgi:hypothetical protein
MKKYIAIAALAVASIILVAFAVLPGHSADNTTAQPPTTQEKQVRQEIKQEMDARRAQAMSRVPPITGQPVERPTLYVDDTGSSVLVTTVFAKNGREQRRSFRPALATPANLAETVTPSSQKDKPCVVYVMTSTDRTNWYPVSFGQTFPESKTPRYFKMWTEEDTLTNLAESVEKSAREVENSRVAPKSLGNVKGSK